MSRPVPGQGGGAPPPPASSAGKASVPVQGARPAASFQQAPSFNFFKVPPNLPSQQSHNITMNAPGTSLPSFPAAQQELCLHPSLNKLKKRPSGYEADSNAILQSA